MLADFGQQCEKIACKWSLFLPTLCGFAPLREKYLLRRRRSLKAFSHTDAKPQSLSRRKK